MQLAREPHIDAAKLEQLIAAEERWALKAESLAFAKAFTKMAIALPVIDELGVLKHGDHVIGAYARFEDIMDAIRPILNRFGFALTFDTQQDREGLVVTATLMHAAGHVRTTSLRLPPDPTGDKNAVQAIGSAVSYGKRYTAVALLNLTSRGDDDDGRQASGCIDPESLLALETRITETGADTVRLLRYLEVERLDLIPVARVEAAFAAIEVRASAHEGAQA